MASTLASLVQRTSSGECDARLPPLGDTFWPCMPKGKSPCLRRSSSFAGYFPHRLRDARDTYQSTTCSAIAIAVATTETFESVDDGVIFQEPYPDTDSESDSYADYISRCSMQIDVGSVSTSVPTTPAGLTQPVAAAWVHENRSHQTCSPHGLTCSADVLHATSPSAQLHLSAHLEGPHTQPKPLAIACSNSNSSIDWRPPNPQAANCAAAPLPETAATWGDGAGHFAQPFTYTGDCYLPINSTLLGQLQLRCSQPLDETCKHAHSLPVQAQFVGRRMTIAEQSLEEAHTRTKPLAKTCTIPQPPVAAASCAVVPAHFAQPSTYAGDYYVPINSTLLGQLQLRCKNSLDEMCKDAPALPVSAQPPSRTTTTAEQSLERRGFATAMIGEKLCADQHPPVAPLSTMPPTFRDMPCADQHPPVAPPSIMPCGFTTVMIRNLPKELARSHLLRELDSLGFSDSYDFCYVPCSFTTGEAQGFAFVNFISPEMAASFHKMFHGTRHFGVPPQQSTLNICKAEVQGKNANLKKWQTSRLRRIRNPELLPFVR